MNTQMPIEALLQIHNRGKLSRRNSPSSLWIQNLVVITFVSRSFHGSIRSAAYSHHAALTVPVCDQFAHVWLNTGLHLLDR